MSTSVEYTLPNLSYSYDALEPHISAQIMELHHSKHHQAYVTNLNVALEKLATALSSRTLSDHLDLQQAIRFNGGGHINHSLFWKNLCPASDDATNVVQAAPKLSAALAERWGSVDSFKDAMSSALLGLQGSGWGWLVQDDKKQLRIVTTKDQDIVDTGHTPLLGIDMWEHAYYLQVCSNHMQHYPMHRDMSNFSSTSTAKQHILEIYGISSTGGLWKSGTSAGDKMH